MEKRTGIGASDVAAILGMNKYRTPLQVWLRIMENREPGFCAEHGYRLEETEYNAAMRWGHAFERAIKNLCEDGCGKLGGHGKIGNREKKFTHPDHPFLTCHVDGIYKDGYIHEAKTGYIGTAKEWGEEGTDHVKASYSVQVQTMLMLTGAPGAIVSVLFFPKAPEEWEKFGWTARTGEERTTHATYKLFHDDYARNGIYPSQWAKALRGMQYFRQYETLPDANLQNMILNKLTEWWGEFVEKKTPPTVQNHEDLFSLLPALYGEVDVPKKLADALTEYKNVATEERSVKERKTNIKNSLSVFLSTPEGKTAGGTPDKLSLYHEGKEVGTWNLNVKGSRTLRAK